MADFDVVHHKNLQAFDTVELNTEHRLEFDSKELSAVYPSNADTTEYTVAIFNVSDGTVDLPSGAAVLEASDTVVALVPNDAYGVEADG